MGTPGPISRRRFLQGTAATMAAAGVPAWTRPGPWLFTDANDDRMAWWREARFGMFLHWGLYSVLGGTWGERDDYGEWIRSTAHIPLEEYDKLLARFNPAAFDADRWAETARATGMKYVTITTKHHDGFALFDSRVSDFCVRSTPFRRDIMRELADACRRQGLRICWYHSIMDWHHPDYLPRRDWEAETRPVGEARFTRFVEYLHAQVSELLTRYGDIGVMWFDGNWEQTWTHEMGQALYERCRGLQPGVIVNNRVNGWSPARVREPLGDFRTPEQEVPTTGWPGVDWESCITMNRNWGYNSHDHDYKTVAQLIGLLVETASKGGNLLLNVGPRGDGTFPEESVERLQAMGRWMAINGEAIYGTTASPFRQAPFRATAAGNRLNLFLADWPAGRLLVPGLTSSPRRVWFVADRARQPLPWTSSPAGMALSLPPTAPDPVCSVIALEFDGPPDVRGS